MLWGFQCIWKKTQKLQANHCPSLCCKEWRAPYQTYCFCTHHPHQVQITDLSANQKEAKKWYRQQLVIAVEIDGVSNPKYYLAETSLSKWMVVRKGSGSDPPRRLEVNRTNYMLPLSNSSIIQIQSHSVTVAGKMSKDVSTEKAIWMFLDLQSNTGTRDFSQGKTSTLPRESKALLLLLFLTGLADNFLSCLFFSRSEFWLDEKFHGCNLPSGRCAHQYLSALQLTPLFQFGNLLWCPQKRHVSVVTHIPLLHRAGSLAASHAHFHGDLTILMFQYCSQSALIINYCPTSNEDNVVLMLEETTSRIGTVLYKGYMAIF